MSEATPGDREMTIAAGMDDHVSKPAKPEDPGALSERWVLAPLARLHGLQGEDEPDIVAELAGVFLDDARSRLQAVEEALQKDDAPAVERMAHMLKGGSGSMGATGISGLCAQLEYVGASGDLSRGSLLLERIREELERVDRALEAEITSFRNRYQAAGIRFQAESAGSRSRDVQPTRAQFLPLSAPHNHHSRASGNPLRQMLCAIDRKRPT